METQEAPISEHATTMNADDLDVGDDVDDEIPTQLANEEELSSKRDVVPEIKVAEQLLEENVESTIEDNKIPIARGDNIGFRSITLT